MEIKKFIVKDDVNIVSWIDQFSPADIILDDYFYISLNSIFEEKNYYSDIQVARIMSLTDREYAQLLEKYFSSEVDYIDNRELEDQNNKQNRLKELEAKIQQSKNQEDLTKKISQIDLKIGKIDKDLRSINDLIEKEKSILKDLSAYAELSKFNMQKIYDDLVFINSQINELEDKSLEFKAHEIKQTKLEYAYDQGKIGLGISIAIGFGLLGAVFWYLNSPDWIYFGIWGFGIFVAILFIIFARYKLDENTPNNSVMGNDYDEIQQKIYRYKRQRDEILNLLNFRSSDEFFLVKAKLSSSQKSLEALRQQRELLSNELNYVELMKQKAELERQKQDLSKNIQTNFIPLTPDQYLEVYREIDSLKLALSSTNKDRNLSKNEIPKKLADIRNELHQKLPNYVRLLKSTFQRSFAEISNKINEYSLAAGISPFVIDNTLTTWNSLSSFQKFLVYFTLSRLIYTNKYYLICERIDWRIEDKAYFDKLFSGLESENFNLVILEK